MLLFKHARIVEVFGVRQVRDIEKTKETSVRYTQSYEIHVQTKDTLILKVS
jgi:hypothetical protein